MDPEDEAYLEQLASDLEQELQHDYKVMISTGYVSHKKRLRWYDRVLIVTICNPYDWLQCQRHIMFRTYRYPKSLLPVDIYFVGI